MTIRPITLASLQEVYGKDQADTHFTAYLEDPSYGIYDPKHRVIFVKVGRPMVEVASTIVHEGVHLLLHQRTGGRSYGDRVLDGFGEEFQAHAAQRDFLVRAGAGADPRTSSIPRTSGCRGTTDDQLRQFVADLYQHLAFSRNQIVSQADDVVFIADAVQKHFGKP